MSDGERDAPMIIIGDWHIGMLDDRNISAWDSRKDRTLKTGVVRNYIGYWSATISGMAYCLEAWAFKQRDMDIASALAIAKDHFDEMFPDPEIQFMSLILYGTRKETRD